MGPTVADNILPMQPIHLSLCRPSYVTLAPWHVPFSDGSGTDPGDSWLQ